MVKVCLKSWNLILGKTSLFQQRFHPGIGSAGAGAGGSLGIPCGQLATYPLMDRVAYLEGAIRLSQNGPKTAMVEEAELAPVSTGATSPPRPCSTPPTSIMTPKMVLLSASMWVD